MKSSFTPDYARLEAEAQNNPSYAYGDRKSVV